MAQLARINPAQTVSSLAAQIVSKTDGKTTRFDVTLDPDGLGKVNVAVEINAKGEISATLSFQHAAATEALSSHSEALRQALADSGLNLAPEDLTFQTGLGGSSGGGQFGTADQNFAETGRNAFSGASAFSAAAGVNAAAENLAFHSLSAGAQSGLNIVI